MNKRGTLSKVPEQYLSNMAAPLTHIFLAQVYLQKKTRHASAKFFLGTSFPDIRYLGVIKREQTHIKDPSLARIDATINDFQAGMEFHAWVDIVRQKKFETSSLYSSDKTIIQAWKLIEDEVLREKISLTDLHRFQSYFNNVVQEERDFNISDEAIKKWHSILQTYFLEESILKSQMQFMTDLTIPQERKNHIMKIANELRSSHEVLNLIQDIYNHFFD